MEYFFVKTVDIELGYHVASVDHAIYNEKLKKD